MIRGVIGAAEQVDLRNQISTDKAGKAVAAIIEYVIQGGQSLKQISRGQPRNKEHSK